MPQITHLNPAELPRNPAFSQGVQVSGPATTISVSVVAGLANPAFLVEVSAIAVTA